MSEVKQVALVMVIIAVAAPILRRWLGIEWGYAIPNDSPHKRR